MNLIVVECGSSEGGGRKERTGSEDDGRAECATAVGDASSTALCMAPLRTRVSVPGEELRKGENERAAR